MNRFALLTANTALPALCGTTSRYPAGSWSRLPRFVAAFLNSKPISDAEAAEIRALLDAARYKEE